jgi:hypothetical protein
MSDNTPRLKLPELAQMQELNGATINEALVQLDALTDVFLKGQFVNTPPASPADGDMYLLGSAPTGAWSGYAYKLAYCLDGAWRFFTPFDGLRAVLATTGGFIFHQGGSWSSFNPPPSAVAFPAVQVASGDPNTLDDYAEGSFTPALTWGGGNAGLAYNSQAGRYTKTGNRVTINGLVDVSAIGSSSGAALIGGLPFAASAAGACCPVPMTVSTISNTVSAMQAFIAPGDSAISIYALVSGAHTQITRSYFAGPPRFMFAASYEAA